MNSKKRIKIAIIRRNGLGDFICGTVPLVNYLREQFNNSCDLYFFMGHMNYKLVKLFYPQAHVYVINKGNKYYSALRVAAQNRNIHFDLGISPFPDYPKLNNLFLYVLGAKERYAHITHHLIAEKTINHPLLHIENMPDLPIGLCSIKVFDKHVDKLDIRFYPQMLQSILPKFKPSIKGPIILTEVSNNRVHSLLDVSKVATILNNLVKTQSFSVILTGKKGSEDRALKLKQLLKMPVEICFRDKLEDYLAVVNSADIVLTGDGGLGHIAGALNKRIVAMYGQTSIAQWGILTTSVVHLYDADNINYISNDLIEKALSKQMQRHNK